MTEPPSPIRELFLGRPGRPGPAGVVLTVEELAEIVRVNERTIYALIAQGQLGAFKVGSQWRIPTAAAIAHFEATLGLDRETIDKAATSRLGTVGQAEVSDDDNAE